MIQGCLFQDFVQVDVQQLLIREHLCWLAQRCVPLFIYSCKVVLCVHSISMYSTCRLDGIHSLFCCLFWDIYFCILVYSFSLLSIQNYCQVVLEIMANHLLYCLTWKWGSWWCLILMPIGLLDVLCCALCNVGWFKLSGYLLSWLLILH